MVNDRGAIDAVRADRSRMVQALEAAGAQVEGDTVRCPFHDDSHPSGGIHQHGAVWYFTCHGCTWNGERETGDVIDVVQRARKCDFDAACAWLGITKETTNGDAAGPSSDELRAVDVNEHDVQAEADDHIALAKTAHERLLRDEDALAHLWKTRAIDKQTAKTFLIGLTGKTENRYWTVPIHTLDGEFVAVKAHRADKQDPKCWWSPKGVKSRFAWPMFLDHEGPVWLCPGELKALAVIAVGRSAVAITSGEGTTTKPADLPSKLFELVRGRAVAIVADDDDTGRAWAQHVQSQLADAGIEARIVDLGLSRVDRLKDIGDWLVRRRITEGSEAMDVAADLDAAYARSDPWYGVTIGEIWQNTKTWEPATVVSTGFGALDDVLGGGLRTGWVHLLCGKPGQAKTQLAVAITLNAARAGQPVSYFSLELCAIDVAQLAIASLAGIPRLALVDGSLSEELSERFQLTVNRNSEIPFTVLDDSHWSGGLDRESLAQLVDDGVRRFGWRVVVLDYLGLMATREDDTFQADVLNSAALRKIARTNDVALLVVAALRKSPTSGSQSKQVPLDDVAGAGQLVYDAASVLHVSCKHGKDSGTVAVQALKLRFSSMHNCKGAQLWWNPGTGAIYDEHGDDERKGNNGA